MPGERLGMGEQRAGWIWDALGQCRLLGMEVLEKKRQLPWSPQAPLYPAPWHWTCRGQREVKQGGRGMKNLGNNLPPPAT